MLEVFTPLHVASGPVQSWKPEPRALDSSAGKSHRFWGCPSNWIKLVCSAMRNDRFLLSIEYWVLTIKVYLPAANSVQGWPARYKCDGTITKEASLSAWLKLMETIKIDKYVFINTRRVYENHRFMMKIQWIFDFHENLSKSTNLMVSGNFNRTDRLTFYVMAPHRYKKIALLVHPDKCSVRPSASERIDFIPWERLEIPSLRESLSDLELRFVLYLRLRCHLGAALLVHNSGGYISDFPVMARKSGK